MKKSFLFLFLIFTPLSVLSQDTSAKETFQDVCRAWFWTSEHGTEQLEIDLTEVDGAIKGTHCSVAYNGRYVDCSDQDTSIELKGVGLDIYEGTIRSGYSGTTGKIRLTYNKSNSTVHFELLEEPSGIFYLPKDVVME